MSSTPVGEIRPSQLLWSYGPGALIDLPNISVITQGIDGWDVSQCNEVLEAKMNAGSSGYDIVVPTSDFLARGRQAGAYQDIRPDLLKNLGKRLLHP